MEEISLYPHQQEGHDWLIERGSGCLVFDTGLGKSRTSLATVHTWDAQDILIVCPKVVAFHWGREILKLFKEESVDIHIALGNKASKENVIGTYARKKLLHPQNRAKKNFLITNYHSLSILNEFRFPKINEDTGRVILQSLRWDVKILDECQYIKNHTAKMFKAAKNVKSKHSILLTATPTSQGPKDLWAYLNIIEPNTFNSFWKFVYKHLEVEKNHFKGTDIKGAKFPKEFREMLRPYFMRKKKKDMGPVKTRDLIEVDMYPKQAKYYKELKDELMAITESDDLILLPNGASKTLRLRQLLVAPQTLDLGDKSATLEGITELVATINAPTVIFTPFKSAFPFIEKALPKKFQKEVYYISGGLSNVDEIVQQFETSTNLHRVLIATVQLSQGYEILSANHAIFAGVDWSNVIHIQAEGRLDRLTKTEPVHFYYIVNRDTVEVDVLKTIDRKIKWDTNSLHTD
jgi:SNF2 family DNA or RNA helicase